MGLCGSPIEVNARNGIPHLAGTPALFVTGLTAEADIARYAEVGAIGVIPKPLMPLRLTGSSTVTGAVEVYIPYGDAAERSRAAAQRITPHSRDARPRR